MSTSVTAIVTHLSSKIVLKSICTVVVSLAPRDMSFTTELVLFLQRPSPPIASTSSPTQRRQQPPNAVNAPPDLCLPLPSLVKLKAPPRQLMSIASRTVSKMTSIIVFCATPGTFFLAILVSKSQRIA